VITAPASGLYLTEVKYPPKFLDESYTPDFEEKKTANSAAPNGIK